MMFSKQPVYFCEVMIVGTRSNGGCLYAYYHIDNNDDKKQAANDEEHDTQEQKA